MSQRLNGALAAVALVITASGTSAPAAALAPRAALSVVADADGVLAGGTLRLAVRLQLPADVHVQSDRPRDPFLIGTTVTPTLPSGVALLDTVFPIPTDFTQAGVPEPLSVFEHDITIGLQLRVDDTVAPGVYPVPVRVRYQACNDRNCFPPTLDTVIAAVTVMPPGASPRQQHQDVFTTLRFRQ